MSSMKFVLIGYICGLLQAFDIPISLICVSLDQIELIADPYTFHILIEYV